jgi:hypothetical protein
MRESQIYLHHLKSWTHYITTGWRRQLLIVALISLSVGVTLQVILSNWTLITTHRWQLQPSWLLIVFVIFLLDYLLALWIWHLLVLRLTGYNNLRGSWRIYLRSNLVRRIPGPAVWHIASRATQYQEVGVDKLAATLLGVLESLFFIVSGFVTVLLMLPFWFSSSQIHSQFNLTWFIPVTFAATALIAHPRLLAYLWQKFSRQEQVLNLRWRDTLLWLFLYVLTWMLGGLVVFSIINFVYSSPFTLLPTVVGAWAFAGSISMMGAITLTSIGVREVSLLLILSAFLPLPITLLVVVIVRVLWLLGELLGGLIGLRL